MSPALFDKSKEMSISPLFLGASALLVLAYVIRAILNRPQKLDFPVMGHRKNKDFRAALIEGTAKYPNSPFIIPEEPPLVILPISTHDEVRNIPESETSFQKELDRMFYAKHTGLGTTSIPLIKTVKTDLTRHVASTVDALQDEMRYGMDKEFGICDNWTKVVLYEKLLRMVALLSGRVFVGRPLSRSEDWIETSIQFTIDAVAAKEKVQTYPALLRYFAVPFLPEIVNVNKRKRKAEALLRPLMNECIQKFKEGKVGKELGGELGNEFDDEQGTFLSWIMKWMEENTREDLSALAMSQLSLSFAAIHTTTMATSHIIFDLVSHPQFFAPLREEIDRVLEEDGYETDESGSKNLKKQSFAKLKKLDSFMKESQRINPPGLIANLRQVITPIHLSTGHVIPTGSRIGYDAHSVNLAGPKLSSLPKDPSSIPSLDPPNVFSPFRFSSLRSIPGNEAKYQYVTTTGESLNFGHGNHACPGRFFAGVEIKVVLVELLRNWDFRLVGDVEGKGGERPANHMYNTTVGPNTFAKIEFRRKKV